MPPSFPAPKTASFFSASFCVIVQTFLTRIENGSTEDSRGGRTVVFQTARLFEGQPSNFYPREAPLPFPPRRFGKWVLWAALFSSSATILSLVVIRSGGRSCINRSTVECEHDSSLHPSNRYCTYSTF